MKKIYILGRILGYDPVSLCYWFHDWLTHKQLRLNSGWAGRRWIPPSPILKPNQRANKKQRNEGGRVCVLFMALLLQRCCGSCVRTTLLFGDRREGPPTAILPVFRRRLITGVGSASLVAVGANFAGITSFLLGLSPDIGRRLKLDVLYPVDGYSRCFDANQGFGEFDYF